MRLSRARKIATAAVFALMTAALWSLLHARGQHISPAELSARVFVIGFDVAGDVQAAAQWVGTTVECSVDGTLPRRRFEYPTTPGPSLKIRLESDSGSLLRIAVWPVTPLKGGGPQFQGYYELPRGDYSLIQVTVSGNWPLVKVFSRWKWRPWGWTRHVWSLNRRGLVVTNRPEGGVASMVRVQWGARRFRPEWVLPPGEFFPMAYFATFPPPSPPRGDIMVVYPSGMSERIEIRDVLPESQVGEGRAPSGMSERIEIRDRWLWRHASEAFVILTPPAMLWQLRDAEQMP